MLTAAQQLYERGHREGEAQLLREQLEYKFGALPKRIQQRLAEADEADLRTWSLRLLTATALDEVFPKTPRRRSPA